MPGSSLAAWRGPPLVAAAVTPMNRSASVHFMCSSFAESLGEEGDV